MVFLAVLLRKFYHGVSVKTELNNRVLWFDGTNEVKAELVPDLLLSEVPLNRIVVPEPNSDLLLFNMLNDEEIWYSKTENEVFNIGWNIPDSFMKMDLGGYVREKLEEFLQSKNFTAAQIIQYSERTRLELDEIKFYCIEPLFKTLIYAISKFKETGTVWGVGRGSSCASLVLFLIGLHKVDPILYNIPITEFFHS